MESTYGIEIDGLKEWESVNLFQDNEKSALVIEISSKPEGLPPVAVRRMVSLREIACMREEVIPEALLSIVQDTLDKFRILTSAYPQDDDDNND